MHADPELLALLALGEVGTEDERLHAGTCADCAAEVSELRQLVSLSREVSDDMTMVAPSEAVWARIRSELALSPTLQPSGKSSEQELTARARLSPVDESWSHASGRAALATDQRGRRVLQVDLHADLSPVGVRQAWLVHRDDPSLRQTLGILDGPYGMWTVDHSIDLQAYAILDISQQDDGSLEHSGQTIVRGELTLAS